MGSDGSLIASRRDGNFRRILFKHKRLISRTLIVNDGLLSDLCELELFDHNINHIEREKTNKGKVYALLDILCSIPPQHSVVFMKFMEALRRDGQGHVANIFHKESNEQPMSDKKYQLLTSQVQKIIIPSPDLLEKLVDDEVFSYNDMDQIMKYTDDIQHMTIGFVDIMSRKPEAALKKFVAALIQTGQAHVATLFGEKSDVVPMSDKHYLSLMNATDELVQFMDPESGLIRRLTDRDIFNRYDVERIGGKKELEAKCREVINLLVRKPDSAFQEFIDALCDTEQQHVANILGYRESTEIPNNRSLRQRLIGKRQEISRSMDPHDSRLADALLSSSIPMTEEHVRRLNGSRIEISDYMDPASTGLVDKLVKERILSAKEANRIRDIVKAEFAYNAKSLELLDLLTRKSDAAFDAFIDALISTGQAHVVYIITGRGDELPMSHLRRQIFDIMKEKLISSLTIENQLLEKLIKRGVINHADGKTIEVCPETEQITCLIWLICRKQNSAFDKFIEVLKESGHEHVAAALKGLDVRGEVDTTFSSGSEKTEYIVRITRAMQGLVSGSDMGDINAIRSFMEKNGFEVSSVRKGSILISFRCFTAQSLENLKRLYVDKTLDKLLTEVFCPEFAEAGLESLSLNIPEEEFNKCAEIFSEMDHLNMGNHNSSHTHVLPLELLELVLMKGVARLLLVKCKLHHDPHEAVQSAYSSLATVCYNWWETMNGLPESTSRCWFKREARQSLQILRRPYALRQYLRTTLPLLNTESNRTSVVCRDKQFAVCSKLASILTLEKKPAQWPVLDVAELEHPLVIVAWDETQVLYVYKAHHRVFLESTDGRLEEVKLAPSKKSEASFCKRSSRPVWPRTLLLISISIVRVVIQRVKEVQHFVEATNATFVICCRKPRPHAIEFSDKGSFIRDGDKLLSNPRNLALYSDGSIFAVDSDLTLSLKFGEIGRQCIDEKSHDHSMNGYSKFLQFLDWSARRVMYFNITCRLVTGGFVVRCGDIIMSRL